MPGVPVSAPGPYIVHIKRHCGWHTTTAEGETFADAAVAAVVATCKRFGLDLDRIPHTVEFRERPNTDTIRFADSPETYQSVVFRWAEPHRVFDPLLYGGWGWTEPGDYWFSHRVREGKPDDCRPCGGTGHDAYNPFKSCPVCGDGSRLVEVSP